MLRWIPWKKRKLPLFSNIYTIESSIPSFYLLCQLLVSCSESKAFAQSLSCSFSSCEEVRINYNSILKKKCTTYISLLSFEEVLSTLYFSAVWRMMMIRDDQFGGPIMTNRKDLVGKISTSVPHYSVISDSSPLLYLGWEEWHWNGGRIWMFGCLISSLTKKGSAT